MRKLNDLKKRICSCKCKRCRALVWLVEDCGAWLQFTTRILAIGSTLVKPKLHS
jgi:hypothetical protein